MIINHVTVIILFTTIKNIYQWVSTKNTTVCLYVYINLVVFGTIQLYTLYSTKSGNTGIHSSFIQGRVHTCTCIRFCYMIDIYLLVLLKKNPYICAYICIGSLLFHRNYVKHVLCCHVSYSSKGDILSLSLLVLSRVHM